MTVTHSPYFADAERPPVAEVPAARAAAMAEDMGLIREGARIARELAAPSPAIYWSDFLASALMGYAAFAGALLLDPIWLRWLSGAIAVLALYRASSFIHEITHLKPGAVPGFRTGWNLLIGIPMLIPSFLYEGTHNQHHSKARYGTVNDPEYLPLARMKPWSLPLFLLAAALGPIGFLIRFGLLSPLSLVSSWVRRETVARLSTLAINPAYRRSMPEGRFARDWLMMEAGASLWAIAVLAGVATGAIPLPVFAVALAIVSAALVLNQVRTLVAHLWDNDGDAISVTAQFLDSVNVPPPALLPALWAPVGLRYHALHHLMPSVPYHALGKAHRALVHALPDNATYRASNHAGLTPLLLRLMQGNRTA